jgi:hypothetical protein
MELEGQGRKRWWLISNYYYRVYVMEITNDAHRTIAGMGSNS